MNEPRITINGVTITNAMSMTIRVAVESFAADLSRHGLGDDDVGKGICAGYLARSAEIRALWSEDVPA